MGKVASGFGRFLIGAATFLLLGALVCFALGSYLLYWPLSKASPRFAKMRAAATLLADLQALWLLAQKGKTPGEPEPVENPVPPRV